VTYGKNGSDTCETLRGLWGRAMKKSNVFEWHKQFKEGYENMEDDERSNCPRSHSTDENV
jgi:hypothetical protein